MKNYVICDKYDTDGPFAYSVNEPEGHPFQKFPKLMWFVLVASTKNAISDFFIEHSIILESRCGCFVLSSEWLSIKTPTNYLFKFSHNTIHTSDVRCVRG